MKLAYYIILLLSTGSSYIYGLKINRVILATDKHPNYVQFWPLVARAWKCFIGVQPTLAFIAPKNTPIDTSIGDVFYFEPLAGVPTAQQAQIIRLLLPTYFPNDGCIIADIDMLPLSKEYFITSMQDIPDDHCVVYRDEAYGKDYPQYPMCYIAAQGKVFQEIFGVTTIDDIPALIRAWYSLGYGWITDEKILYTRLQNWSDFKTRCTKLGGAQINRIDRGELRDNKLVYNKKLLQQDYYVDCHMPRPYNKYKDTIDCLIQDKILYKDFVQDIIENSVKLHR